VDVADAAVSVVALRGGSVPAGAAGPVAAVAVGAALTGLRALRGLSR
jgi:hypothetical protein